MEIPVEDSRKNLNSTWPTTFSGLPKEHICDRHFLRAAHETSTKDRHSRYPTIFCGLPEESLIPRRWWQDVQMSVWTNCVCFIRTIWSGGALVLPIFCERCLGALMSGHMDIFVEGSWMWWAPWTVYSYAPRRGCLLPRCPSGRLPQVVGYLDHRSIVEIVYASRRRYWLLIYRRSRLWASKTMSTIYVSF